MPKKTWIKPELIVLVRNTSDENILAKCKSGAFSAIQALAGNGQTSYTSCRRQQGKKKCKSCNQFGS